ncbi:hypothetical protein [Pseudomonas rossensis]|uniref:hypothetical protein n=1 Tax=Pseudomonas rossensis TaxID=2305471 RepID=UPI003260AEAA
MNADDQPTTPSFAEAKPLGEEDAPFIGELHALLERHGNTKRFGIFLLHNHFAIKGDEIMLESNDPDARTLHMEVVKRTDLPEGKFTSWRMSGTQPLDKKGVLNEIEALTFCGRPCF